MNKWDDLAMVTFIACDVIIENTENFKLFSNYFYKNLKYESKDILKRLFK